VKKFGIIILLASLSACSSAPTETNPTAVEKRNPSNFNGDPNISWESQPLQFDVGPQGADNNFPPLTVTEYQVQQVAVPDNNTNCTEDREVAVQGQYPSYQNCAATAGDAPAWAAFDQARTEDQKIKGLANAIKGVGVKSATALIQNGYFRTRPRTWSQFQAELRRAADQGVIQKSVYTQSTVGTYQSANFTNLGLSTVACQPVMVPGTYYVIKSFPVPCPPTTHLESRKVPIDQQFLHVHVVVRNPMLQSFEKDSVKLQLGYNGQIVSLEAGPYTTYQPANISMTDNNVLIMLNGQFRNAVPLPGDIVQNATLAATGSEKVTFQVSVNNNYIPHTDSDELHIRYQVKTCDVGWFGACNPMSWSNGNVVDTVIRPNQNPFSVDINAPNSKKVNVSYQLYRRNSRFYNSDPVPAGMTDASNFPVRPNR
jgi:hypothetical protein